MRHLISIGFVFCICSGAAAQHTQHGGAPLVGGHIPREIVERPVPIRTGIGKVTHPTSTTSTEAQAYYEQGLAYLHSYVWIEAARSFHQAVRLDPKFALAWVGLSRAFTGLEDSDAANDAHAKAKALAGDVTPREKRWIEIRTRQLESLADAQNGSKRLAYVAAIDDALEYDPQDAELWTQRGNADEVRAGASGRGQRGGASSIVFYEEAIRRVPGHFGAHHYLIHSYENVGLFDKALMHGEVYAAAASQVPHALHMYGHDLMKTGQMAKAIEIFGRARKLEHDYYAAEDIKRDYDWHHAHNTSLLALSYRHMGRLGETQQMLEDAAAVQQSSEARGSYYRGLVADVLIARGTLDEALAIGRKLAAMPQRSAKDLGNAISARAHLAAGRLEDARKHIDTLPKIEDPGGNMYAGYAGFHVDIARGDFLLRTGRKDDGAKLLSEALARARRQRTPDGWIEGLFFLETIFHTARAAGDWTLARRAADLLLEHDKAYGGTQYAVALLAEHEGKRAEATAALAEATRLWQHADADYAPVREMRSR